MNREKVTIDANEAVAHVAYRLSEVIAIYPITPSSGMGELSDAWAGQRKSNLWGTVPSVMEMQSEGGAAGAVHGALQTGSLTTTFTASQGLLLMIPNMYKIAGELTPTVFHVTARSLAAQGLSIFGDHSDVMATRGTGFAMLASRSVQEAHDMALISHAATLESRIPFVHFFDGFRTSHEINKMEQLSDDDLRAMVDDSLISEFRTHALTPDHPVLRGTAQNPDVYFQGRETVNPYYLKCPGIVQKAMDKFASLTGRNYHLFDYTGAPDADRVIVVMGSGAEVAEETAAALNAKGEKLGVVTVHLFRPFSMEHLIQALPVSVKSIAVLDRTKEPGSAGEPLYQDVVTAINENMASSQPHFKAAPRILSGRFGLSSKEFTAGMVKAVFENMSAVNAAAPKNHFTIGINDDVTHSSLEFDPSFSIENPETVRCVFFGLGSDGTVGANKNSIKIIGEETDNYAQGYFVYDSKKSGTVTISHLRFGTKPIHAPYLISHANFVACHQFSFLERIDITKYAIPGGVFLLNSIYGPDEVWDHLPQEVQTDIINKKLRFYTIDGYQVAEKTGMGGRVNTIMQTCFFAISGVLPREQAIEEIKKSIKKTYGKRGEAVVQQNFDAVDHSLAALHEVKVPDKVTSKLTRRKPVADNAPDFVKKVLGPMIAFNGDLLPVSAMPVDGTFPTSTSQWEKRNIALEIPVWEPDLCIQCGKCSFVCPHAVIRQKVYEPANLENAPATFKSMDAKFKELPGMKFTIQIAPEDCTSCGLCIEVCPAKDKTNVSRKALNMADQPPLREPEKANWEFFLDLPEADRSAFAPSTIKNSQLLQPLFEFSGACAGCGETPYVKLVSQLFGDHTLVANATGCSSIYGGNLPTTPWASNKEGRGPSWSNSLFEDNAEFGLGMRLTLDKQTEYAQEMLKLLSGEIGSELADGLLTADQSTEAGIKEQRNRIVALKSRLGGIKNPAAARLVGVADSLVRKSVWIMGGDGWAYDIGYGGLDHVIASGRNINILVLDTEVYSNTGGQSSKSTPRAAVAKFAAKGKNLPKKDLGLIAMAYGYVYVAQVAMGASDVQTLKAFLEADAYDGPSLIIAYSHCINHGIDMRKGLDQQRLAVQSGIWPLYRYNPDLADEGKNPLIIDSKDPSVTVEEYAYNETRYRMLLQSDEARAEMLMKSARQDVTKRWELYQQMAAIEYKARNS
ncbi:MAG: pyruvate:ferredoxin (flavodoxin) oxidoreductase [Anaerolineaceae bacterium]